MPHRHPVLASPLLSPAPIGSISLKIDDDTARFRNAIILHEIETPSSPRARLSSSPPPWAPSLSRSVMAIPVSTAPSSSARSRPPSIVSTRSSAISPNTKPSTSPSSIYCRSSSSSSLAILSPSATTPAPASPPWYPSSPIPVPASLPSPSSPPSCPTAMPPLAPPSTPSSPSSSPRPASPSPAVAAPSSPFPDLSGRLEPQCQEPPSKAWAGTAQALVDHFGLAHVSYHACYG